MTFIDTLSTIIAAERPQIYSRYVAVGRSVEVTFKVFQAVASGQILVGGQAAAPRRVKALPFAVGIDLDDGEAARSFPSGRPGPLRP